ncbi:MAG: hypothetical protein KBB39_17660 [Phycicoccus sp.]|nr:hypothetical protein [Phycicoccus sp.]
MKRILLTLAILALPSLAVAQPALIGTVAGDGKTTATSAANPMPVAGTVTTTDQKGAGATTATTLRTVTATDSPEVTVLSVLSTALGTLGVAIPPLGVLMSGTDGVLLQALRVVDLDLGAGTDYYQGVGLMLRAAGGGAFVSGGNGAADTGTIRVSEATDSALAVSLGTIDDVVHSSAALFNKTVSIGVLAPSVNRVYPAVSLTNNVGNGTLQVVQASIATGTSAHVAVNASEVAVLAAKAGRRFARVQVYADADGAVCCALGATTNACADGIMLDASPDATHAGGSAEWEGYGGAITCRAAGAWTTTVATEEW